MLIFALLGLLGGVLFGALGEAFEVDHEDAEFALLVLPIYALLIAVNLALVIVFHPDLAPEERRRVVREAARPGLPVEVISGLIATAAVLAARTLRSRHRPGFWPCS